MSMNVKATEQVAILGAIAPSSQAAGAATTGWISMAAFNKALAVIQSGTLGTSATIDAKLQQATSSAGAGAKDIAGKAITQLTGAPGANVQVEINLDAQELDVANGFSFVQLSVTVGTAASGTAALLFGFVPRFAPASDSNATTVAQIVG
ncbi:hypothetical protein [Burkholderia gladioli]|uniref:hypothetical protein n=1 Tax=Burkholderia gladioli TaxID=28095 RepID=UPI00163F30DE|nr:hypothetical protein [Burkholderia gladioli]